MSRIIDRDWTQPDVIEEDDFEEGYLVKHTFVLVEWERLNMSGRFGIDSIRGPATVEVVTNAGEIHSVRII